MGASGYTGSEVLRILLKHPLVKIKTLIGKSTAGRSVSDIFSNFHGVELPIINTFEKSDFTNIDVLFSCVPSGVLSEKINRLPSKIVVIDLSSDFRFQDINIYNAYYSTHKNPSLVKSFIYGLTEVFRDKIKNKNLISCPGCYPTSVLLPLIPILTNDLVKSDQIIIDSKSGISGAGRNITQGLLFCENFGSMQAYGNGNHRHKPEIEHIIQIATNKNFNIVFTPHIIPINRGILSSIYIKANYLKVNECLNNFYKNSKFVKINKKGYIPKISDVTGSNLCRIGFIENNNSEWITIISVIDNLVKGASGQAVQNLNVVMNYPEELGLDNQSLSP
jgi:N-acetyl-gamma-glutamyl-phosphate reductase